eukprot:1659712-Amphidinium_carterae.1
MFMDYADRMGGRPHQREEPTVEQLSGLRHLLLQDQVPYCDFAVFGPDGRQQGKLHVEIPGAGLGGRRTHHEDG